MSEEEIKSKNFNLDDKIKNSIEKSKKIIDKTKEYTGDCSEAESLAFDFQYVQKLLDLYNKEKEKNKLLIEGKFREVADKNSYIKDNYVSKDRIKEEIKKQKEMNVDGEVFKTAVNYAIKILKELLEE